ncbi:substrate-binding periplasmic protein [Aestuariispira insulae]|uniref:Amino acid ABC transporter substrate-binding protein (PAAT family) n=1 Tax=Aestuariispira insulae TaxID=1461337 RepID=A0A3D9HNH3_9PROT|nr:ABC transporter substrate-binding protein [Aestuariispira insulae]RED51050.1 amino acid ABC transporter substrate-binding protein (PAAT family) [Aestuariispira insulae]
MGQSLAIRQKLMICFSFLALSFFLIPPPAAFGDSLPIKVLGYHFPPYLDQKNNQGITHDFLEFLNENQENFQFKLEFTTSKRRYRALEQRRGDMFFFEMPEWGWEGSGVAYQSTRPILRGGEYYIALAKPDRDQSYFLPLRERKIAAILGFHYGFANFNADQKWLKAHFNIILSNSQKKNLDLLRKHRVEVAVMPISFLAHELRQQPELHDLFLVSEQPDQFYHLGTIIHPDAPIATAEMEAMLQQLKKSGQLQRFFERYNLGNQLIY